MSCVRPYRAQGVQLPRLLLEDRLAPGRVQPGCGNQLELQAARVTLVVNKMEKVLAGAKLATMGIMTGWANFTIDPGACGIIALYRDCSLKCATSGISLSVSQVLAKEQNQKA